jgi:hypothetical protein
VPLLTRQGLCPLAIVDLIRCLAPRQLLGVVMQDLSPISPLLNESNSGALLIQKL